MLTTERVAPPGDSQPGISGASMLEPGDRRTLAPMISGLPHCDRTRCADNPGLDRRGKY